MSNERQRAAVKMDGQIDEARNANASYSDNSLKFNFSLSTSRPFSWATDDKRRISCLSNSTTLNNQVNKSCFLLPWDFFWDNLEVLLLVTLETFTNNFHSIRFHQKSTFVLFVTSQYSRSENIVKQKMYDTAENLRRIKLVNDKQKTNCQFALLTSHQKRISTNFAAENVYQLGFVAEIQ